MKKGSDLVIFGTQFMELFRHVVRYRSFFSRSYTITDQTTHTKKSINSSIIMQGKWGERENIIKSYNETIIIYFYFKKYKEKIKNK